MRTVAVVGGGIVGTAVAAACARAGHRVTLVERGVLAGGASGLDLALLTAEADARPYLELHHFTGGAFFLDRSPPDEWPARRIDARAAAAAFAVEARSFGAEIRTGCEAKAILMRSDAVRGLLTDAGELGADAVVLATGTETGRLCAPLGIVPSLAVETGELVVVEAPRDTLDRPLVADGAWIAPDETGSLHVAYPERAGHLLPGLERLAVVDRRTLCGAAGTPGLVDGVRGLVLACTPGARGVEKAPVVASSVAEWVAHG